MNIRITGHQLELTPAIEAIVKKKLEHINHKVSEITDMHVVLSAPHKTEHRAEGRLIVSGTELFAEAVSDDMYHTIDLLADKLERQVIKWKETR